MRKKSVKTPTTEKKVIIIIIPNAKTGVTHLYMFVCLSVWPKKDYTCYFSRMFLNLAEIFAYKWVSHKNSTQAYTRVSSRRQW